MKIYYSLVVKHNKKEFSILCVFPVKPDSDILHIMCENEVNSIAVLWNEEKKLSEFTHELHEISNIEEETAFLDYDQVNFY